VPYVDSAGRNLFSRVDDEHRGVGLHLRHEVGQGDQTVRLADTILAREQDELAVRDTQ
jgi:hypothetical protein